MKIGTIEHVHLVTVEDGKPILAGTAVIEPGVIQVAHDLAGRMMLRNAVGLLQRIVDARVLAHAGPDGLELDARRIVRWYTDLPAEQRDMTVHVGVDLGTGDRTVTVER